MGKSLEVSCCRLVLRWVLSDILQPDFDLTATPTQQGLGEKVEVLCVNSALRLVCTTQEKRQIQMCCLKAVRVSCHEEEKCKNGVRMWRRREKINGGQQIRCAAVYGSNRRGGRSISGAGDCHRDEKVWHMMIRSQFPPPRPPRHANVFDLKIFAMALRLWHSPSEHELPWVCTINGPAPEAPLLAYRLIPAH